MLLDLVKQSRSFRGYDPSVPLPPETLRGLVECARLTPSTRNAQPLKFVSVSTPETVGSLQKLTHWAGRLPQLHLPHEGKHPSAFLVICLDTRIAENPAPFQRLWRLHDWQFRRRQGRPTPGTSQLSCPPAGGGLGQAG